MSVATPAPPARATRVGPTTKRLNLKLAGSAFNDLQALASQTSRTMTELVRLALGLIKIAIEEQGKGNKLIVTTADGDPLREIVLPS